MAGALVAGGGRAVPVGEDGRLLCRGGGRGQRHVALVNVTSHASEGAWCVSHAARRLLGTGGQWDDAVVLT